MSPTPLLATIVPVVMALAGILMLACGIGLPVLLLVAGRLVRAALKQPPAPDRRTDRRTHDRRDRPDFQAGGEYRPGVQRRGTA